MAGAFFMMPQKRQKPDFRAGISFILFRGQMTAMRLVSLVAVPRQPTFQLLPLAPLLISFSHIARRLTTHFIITSSSSSTFPHSPRYVNAIPQ